jgi:hypothetical protein
MDYKIELQKNNEELNEIIDKAKALPDAGGSGGGSGKSMFAASVSGRVPEYDHGYATTELNNIFETSAVGAVE